MKKASLIIFALDAADSSLLKKYMAGGFMPNLQKLAERGSQALIKDKNTLIELGIYNLILSGESREATGYYDFRQLIPGTYQLRHHVDGSDFGRDPFWGLLTDREKKVFVMDVFDARIVPDVKGIQIANWGVNNMKRPMSVIPPEIAPEIESWGERIIGLQKMPFTFNDSKLLYREMMTRLERKVNGILAFLEKDDFEVIVIGFGETHTASHQFWRYRPEHAAQDPAWQPTELTDAIRNIYQKTDECIGRILDSFSPETNTFVISRCGFKDQYPIENLLPNFCVSLGYQTLKPVPWSKKLSPLNLLRKIVPLSWRLALSRRFLTTEQRDQILSDRFENNVDWEKTTVFDMASLFTGFLRVNLKGREPQGTVAPGTEYDRLLEQVEQDLRALRDKKSGRPVFHQIVKTKGTFTAHEPQALPDLVVVPHEFPYFIEEVVHPKVNIKHEKNIFYRDTAHDDEGFFVAAGTDLEKKGELSNVSPLDFAPTFLTLLNQPVPDYMPGSPLPVLQKKGLGKQVGR